MDGVAQLVAVVRTLASHRRRLVLDTALALLEMQREVEGNGSQN